MGQQWVGVTWLAVHIPSQEAVELLLHAGLHLDMRL